MNRVLEAPVDPKGTTAAHLWGWTEKGAPGTGHPSGLVLTSLDDFTRAAEAVLLWVRKQRLTKATLIPSSWVA